jgi:hypothetical protein
MQEKIKPILGRDIPWSTIDGKICRIIHFLPLARIENTQIVAYSHFIPYASLEVECREVKGTALLFVDHKEDFQHLYEAFKTRGIGQNEEVLIERSSKRRRWVSKILYSFLPKLRIMITPKGAFEKITDLKWWEQGNAEERFQEVRPIIEWDLKYY